jgi:hypothetical protein
LSPHYKTAYTKKQGYINKPAACPCFFVPACEKHRQADFIFTIIKQNPPALFFCILSMSSPKKKKKGGKRQWN